MTSSTGLNNNLDKLKAVYKQLELSVDQLPLARKPSDIIPGEGDPQANILLIGEAPGYHESVQRRPFVGKSGQLLRTTLTEIGLEPRTVYISNIVKVRPPNNRDPSPQEIEAYCQCLDQEIEILNPQIIITLGRFSMAKFLPGGKISQVHGRLHRVKWNKKSLYILPMYHPAAALYSSQSKESFIEDFVKIEKILQWVTEQEQAQELKEQVSAVLF